MAGVIRGPHNPFGRMGMKVHEWMLSAGVKAAATGSCASNDGTGSRALEAREPSWRFRVNSVSVRRTYEERASMTERTSPSVAADGRGVEGGAAPSNRVAGGAVLWAA